MGNNYTCDPIQFTEPEMDDLLEIDYAKNQCYHCKKQLQTDTELREHHSAEHAGKLMSTMNLIAKQNVCICAHCNKEIGRNEYLPHLAYHSYEFSCSQCTFVTKDLICLVAHDKQDHSIDSLNFCCSDFKKRLKKHFLDSLIVFGNGLVLVNHNLIGTKYDESQAFEAFVTTVVELMKEQYQLLIKNSAEPAQVDAIVNCQTNQIEPFRPVPPVSVVPIEVLQTPISTVSISTPNYGQPIWTGPGLIVPFYPHSMPSTFPSSMPESFYSVAPSVPYPSHPTVCEPTFASEPQPINLTSTISPIRLSAVHSNQPSVIQSNLSTSQPRSAQENQPLAAQRNQPLASPQNQTVATRPSQALPAEPKPPVAIQPNQTLASKSPPKHPTERAASSSSTQLSSTPKISRWSASHPLNVSKEFDNLQRELFAQKKYLNRLFMSNLPYKADEDLIQIIRNAFERLDFPASSEDIINVFRIGANVVVVFKTYDVKKEVMKYVKGHTYRSDDFIAQTRNDKKTTVSFSHFVTPFYKRMFYQIEDMKKEMRIKSYEPTEHGLKVRIKGEEPITILSIDELREHFRINRKNKSSHRDNDTRNKQRNEDWD